jgi:hypothetical protein
LIEKTRFVKMANGHGGRREGAGGKKGMVKKRTLALRAIADEALLSGTSPLDVMLKNMRFYHEEADRLLASILGDVSGKKKKPEALIEALAKLTSFRMSAQKCAVDAAPFVHATLKSVTVDGEVRHTLQAEADAAYRTIEGSMVEAVPGAAARPRVETGLAEDGKAKPADASGRQSDYRDAVVDLADAGGTGVRKD